MSLQVFRVTYYCNTGLDFIYLEQRMIISSYLITNTLTLFLDISHPILIFTKI